jgi:hypothetical protein
MESAFTRKGSWLSRSSRNDEILKKNSHDQTGNWTPKYWNESPMLYPLLYQNPLLTQVWNFAKKITEFVRFFPLRFLTVIDRKKSLQLLQNAKTLQLFGFLSQFSNLDQPKNGPFLREGQFIPPKISKIEDQLSHKSNIHTNMHYHIIK